MIFTGMCQRLIVAVYADDVSPRQFVTAVAGLLNIQSVIASGHFLRQAMHAIIDTVENQFTEPALRHIFKIALRQRERERIAYERAVVIRCQQCPVVVFSHAQQRSAALAAIVLITVGQQFDGIGLFGGIRKRRIAAVSDADISLIVDGLVRVCNRIIIVYPIRVVHNLHPCRHTILLFYLVPQRVDEDNGKVCLTYTDVFHLRRIILCLA